MKKLALTIILGSSTLASVAAGMPWLALLCGLACWGVFKGAKALA